MLKSLIWNFTDKDDDEHWPKKNIGGCLLHLQQLNKLILIGGNFNAIENLNRNLQLNTNILKGIDKNIENFLNLEGEKIKYINEMVYYTKKKNIELLVYDMVLCKWEKKHCHGKVPIARSFHKCYYSNPYIFCFGGIILGNKAENLSVNEFFVMNTITYEWKQILSKVYPSERTDFTWNSINNNTSILFGGASSPSDFFYDDVWLFQYDGSDLYVDSKKEISKSFWKKLPSKGKNQIGKIRAHSSEIIDNYLYIFGGIDPNKICHNQVYRYNFITYEWELIQTYGKPPIARCYHDMSSITKDFIFVYGGITGDLTNMKVILSDCFIFNVKDNVWTEAIIGGNSPIGSIGFSILKLYGTNYHNPNSKTQRSIHHRDRSLQMNSLSISNRTGKDSISILILGGYSTNNNTKIYELMEMGK